MVMPIRALRLQADIIAAGFDITGVGTVAASAFTGDGSGLTGVPLPSNSTLRIDVATGKTYFKNATTALWHEVRVNGPDGNVYFEIDQTGVVL